LQHVILAADSVGIAALMYSVFGGQLFVGIQFAITITGTAEDETPRGGLWGPEMAHYFQSWRLIIQSAVNPANRWRARSNRGAVCFPESQRSQVGTR
jgi:hypothetical protein